MGIGAELIPQCFNPVLYRVSENRIASEAGPYEVRLRFAERLSPSSRAPFLQRLMPLFLRSLHLLALIVPIYSKTPSARSPKRVLGLDYKPRKSFLDSAQKRSVFLGLCYLV